MAGPYHHDDVAGGRRGAFLLDGGCPIECGHVAGPYHHDDVAGGRRGAFLLVGGCPIEC